MNHGELSSWQLQRSNAQLREAIQAKAIILKRGKKDRDRRRAFECREYSLKNYPITRGSYLSWGYGSFKSEYDEYFGEVDDTRLQPHGIGVKYYSDGTIYFGEFQHGVQHTQNSKNSFYLRPNGSTYEGEWVSGKKHGYGKFKYPESSIDKDSYEGEWANNLQHGRGTLRYTDGSVFKGRFRFGVRDGPGVMVDLEGGSVKGIFKDKSITAYVELPPPKVSEDISSGKVQFNPNTLLELAIQSLAAWTLHHPVSPALHPLRIHREFNEMASNPLRFPNSLIVKQLLVAEFYKAYRSMRHTGMSPTFLEKQLASGALVFDDVTVNVNTSNIACPSRHHRLCRFMAIVSPKLMSKL